jgi:thiol-disulfide isomerase/thioredoxin
MVKCNLYCIVFLVCVFFGGEPLKGQDQDGKADLLKIGEICPSFALEDTSGVRMSLESLRGKYVYIDVWASWCYPCRKQVPYLQRLEEELSDKNITFLGISLDEINFRWLGMIQGAKMDGLQWRVLDSKFKESFGIKAIPRFILLDKQGRVVKINMSRPSEPETKDFLLKLKGI